MLPYPWKAIVNQIEHAISNAARRSEESSNRNNEQQIAISAGIKRLTEEYATHNERQQAAEAEKRRRENKTIIALAAAALFTFLLAIFAACQLREMIKVYEPIKNQAIAATIAANAAKQSVETAMEEFYSTHRPRLRIRSIIIDGTGGVAAHFKEGKEISGSLQILSIGETVAKILHSHIFVYWGNHGLPMERTFPPNESEFNQFVCNNGPLKGVKCEMPPGDQKTGSFKSAKVLGREANKIFIGKDGWELYIIGWIAYADSSKIRKVRHLDFARIYVPSMGRFAIVKDDPDYVYDP